MEKAYSRIKWENYPSIATPLNETNLNKMDMSLDEVDNRVLGLDTAKLDKAVANTMVKDIAFNEKTGIFTITLLDGTTKTIDTKLEKVATNFSYDYETQKLVLTLVDGTEQEIDMSTLISQYEFADTSTIGFTVGNEGKITAIVKDGSVTEDKLQPNFLADIKVEVAKGKSYSDSSYENATASLNASKEAKQYRDEAEVFRNQTQAMSGVEIATTEKAGLVKPDGTTITVDADGTIHSLSGQGTVDYTELENKPSINGTELNGNKTLNALGIASASELEKTNTKVDTIIEKADLGIKETATGEEIHLTDSAEGKAVEFALFGKAKQDGEPTPDYPQPIEVSGESGSVAVKSVGSNLYNINDIKNFSFSNVYENDWIEANYTNNKSATQFIQVVLYPSKLIKPNKKYLCVCECVENTADSLYISSNGSGGIFGQFNTSFTYSKNEIGTKLQIITAISDFSNCNTLIRTLLKVDVGTTAKAKFRISILEDTTITADTFVYRPYKETLATIPTENGLCGIKVSANGNYTDQNGQQWICDEVVKYADGSGEYIQRIGSAILDGTISNYKILSGYGIMHQSVDTILPNVKKGANSGTRMMSNIRSWKSGSAWTVGSFGVESNTFWFEDTNNVLFPTVEDWINYLTETNMHVLYELAEPIRTPLTAEEIAEIEKLHTFYPITNISNDFDCGMRIDYVGEGIITTNTEIPIVEPKDEEELESGDNIVTLFGKIKKKLKNVGKGVVDVVDNLLSTSTDLPLSANQGRVLDEKITQTNESLADKESTLSGRINEVNKNLTQKETALYNEINTLSENIDSQVNALDERITELSESATSGSLTSRTIMVQDFFETVPSTVDIAFGYHQASICGNVVVVNMHIKGITGTTKIGNVKDEYKSILSNSYIPVCVNSQQNKYICVCSISSSGDVYIQTGGATITDSDTLMITGTYICKGKTE